MLDSLAPASNISILSGKEEGPMGTVRANESSIVSVCPPLEDREVACSGTALRPVPGCDSAEPSRAGS